MKPSAVLLIDLENFYCSREDHCRNAQPAYDRTRFADDLEKLLGYARSMAEGLPFTVRRAYANFNAARYPGGAPPQYYLRHIPDELMRQGVEPVQVFRLSQNGSKNAADMRMAMDATALLNGVGNVEHFVLVTGDADFIPVILELKRHGHAVSVIGVTGATNALIQRFVDNFELFEDLLAADEVESQSGEPTQASDGLAQVADAVRKLLARTHPLCFAAVKPLLSKELGHPFDPGLFGCDTTGDFLRKYHTELGVIIRPSQHDQEIDLPGAGQPSANGSKSRWPEHPGAKNAPAPEPHSREHYLQLLAGRGSGGGSVRIPAVPWPVLVWGCDAMADLLAPPTGEPTHTTTLLARMIQAAESVPTPDIVKHVRMLYPTLRAGLPVVAPDGVYSLPPGTTGEQIRLSVLGYITSVLAGRLAESGVAEPVRPEALAAVFSPGDAIGQVTAEVAAALSKPPAPVPPLASKAAAADVHTPAGYTRLLKAGGAKGSATESLKILPVPWSSVERVCADMFPVLTPLAGGGALPREQLQARLVELGNDLCLQRYEQHVRRTLGILRAAGDLIEVDGTVSLHPEVTSATELRNRALAFLLQLLQLRLEERGQFEPILAGAFVAALDAGPFAERLAEEVSPFIAWLYRDSGDELRTGDTPPEATADSSDSVASALGAEPEECLDFSAGETPARPDPAWHRLAEVELNEPSKAAADTTSTGSGVLDVAAITSEAVAAASTEPPPPPAEGAKGVLIPSPADPKLELGLPKTEEGPLLAVPVADWLPDDDALQSEGSLRERPVLLPATAKAAPPLPEVPVPAAAALAKIIPPPLPHEAGSNPPLPPPESA